MYKNRPENLNLLHFKFPVTAIASIIHRITGILLFIGMPLVLYILDKALESEAGFMQVKQNFLVDGTGRFVIWLLLSVTAYHVCAGTRHLIMDFGYLETLQSGRIAALMTFLAALLLAILAGVWLW